MGKITEQLQNSIIFSNLFKKTAHKILANSRVTNSRFYNLCYNRKMEGAMRKYDKLPYRLRLENTNICNADCLFCPHPEMKRREGVMDMDLFKKIIDGAALHNIPVVSIHGFGEPLLDKHFLARVDYARERGIKKIATNTNASFLNVSNIPELLSGGLHEIYISFDAATEGTYKKIRPGLDFPRVESNIKRLIEEKNARKLKLPKIYLSFVECPQNQHETASYLKKWRALVDGISVSYLIYWPGENSPAGLLKAGDRRDPCRFLWTDMAVSYDGKVSICCYDYENEIIMGDLFKQDIKDIWGGEKLRRFRRIHQEQRFNDITLCKDCIANTHSRNPWWVVR